VAFASFASSCERPVGQSTENIGFVHRFLFFSLEWWAAEGIFSNIKMGQLIFLVPSDNRVAPGEDIAWFWPWCPHIGALQWLIDWLIDSSIPFASLEWWTVSSHSSRWVDWFFVYQVAMGWRLVVKIPLDFDHDHATLTDSWGLIRRTRLQIHNSWRVRAFCFRIKSFTRTIWGDCATLAFSFETSGSNIHWLSAIPILSNLIWFEHEDDDDRYTQYSYQTLPTLFCSTMNRSDVDVDLYCFYNHTLQDSSRLDDGFTWRSGTTEVHHHKTSKTTLRMREAVSCVWWQCYIYRIHYLRENGIIPIASPMSCE